MKIVTFGFPQLIQNIHPKGLSSFSLPRHMDIASIDNFSIDNKNNIWFYYKDDIVYHYDTQKEELERFIDPIFQRSRRIQLMFHFFVDKEGGYWNGHFFGAVRFKAPEKLFDQYVYQQTGLGEQTQIGLNCRDIIDLGNNKLLVKDSDYKIYLLDRASGKMTNLDYEIPSNSRNQVSPFIYSLSPSRDGRIWAIGPGAILKIDLESGRTNSIALQGIVTPSPANTKMSDMGLPRLFEDTAGQLWFCHNKGLFHTQ